MRTLLVALLVVSAGVASALGAETGVRPNFLFIYTDDQRWDALSVVQREQGERARFPWFQTPNLDKLADDGVRFRNAFVTMALCAPSRAAILTGRYNHFNGIANNHTPFPTNSVTWATQLRAAGYTTAYLGKWHMDSQSGQRPGFDYSASFIGHARYQDAPFEINGLPTPTKGWVDDVSTDYAIEFMRRSKGKPWAMTVGFKTPHGPFEPPERTKDKFADGYARAVPNLNLTPPFPGPIRASTEATNAGARLKVNLNYFRCLAAVDENVGRLLAALDELGLAADTMVIYSSDNGFYLGEHRLSDKRSAYDESLRVPMLLRYPRLAAKGRMIDELVLNIDVPLTLLDFAGVPAPKEMQGRSWRPLLEGQPGDWRRSFFYEYFWEPQRGNPTPSLTAVRTTTAKLIKYKDHDEWTELFDLTADPYETQNLFRQPSASTLRAQLEGEYERQKQAAGYVWPVYADDPNKVASKEALNAWVLDYRFDQDDGDKVHDSSSYGNHGIAKDALLTDGREGRKARRFDGKGVIEVPKASSLNPAVGQWTVEVTFKAGQPDGVVLAHGGSSFGYCVALENGAPVFGVMGSQQLTRLAVDEKVTGQWATLRAHISSDAVTLTLNGQPAGAAALTAGITRPPSDFLQIGADLGSPVLGQARPRFTGLIESVRLYSGDASRVSGSRPRVRPNILLCIADDASWNHFAANGDTVFRTPNFDRVAREGVNFRHAFCSSPSCTPSRGALLSGQNFWRLEEGANLWSRWPNKFAVYPDVLAQAGYHVGLQGKGWGPGDFRAHGRTNNPAGSAYKSFADFLETVPKGQPFCFWFGSQDPHRPYERGAGTKSGKKIDDVTVPPFLPDTPAVRSDLLDYCFEVERFDRNIGAMLKLLEDSGQLDNTLVVITSDNGFPFPRGKANCYDAGTRMPLAIRWPARVKGGRVIDDFVSHTDLAPTLLEAAGEKPPPEMTGHSLWPILVSGQSGQVEAGRDKVFFGRERHANVRAGNVSYPIRAVRTAGFLYLRNFEPDRWPAGDPPLFGDLDEHLSIDGSPSKQAVVEHDNLPTGRRLFDLALGKRPAEELYDLSNDPWQTNNVVAEARYAEPKAKLREELGRYLTETKDPRVVGEGTLFDQYHCVTGAGARQPVEKK